ncbi:MAG: hypothetical protein NTY68_00235 [Candidatus Micrarchaeota archaeon]|nr:hypothetical protein [Candidatus Micrarchaeota archaeon]
MPGTKEIIDRINGNGIKWINLHFIDIFGYIREITINRENVNEETLEGGFETNAIGSIFNEDYNDGLVLIPDMNTYVELPWVDRTARFFCRISRKDGTRYLKDPIYAGDRIKMNSEALGIDSIGIKQRLEFYIFDRYGVDRTYKEGGAAVTLGSKESKWNPNAPILENMNSTSFPNDLYNGMRQQVSQVYSQFFNYSIDRHMHGKNSSSHQSMEVKELDFIDSAFAFISFKQVVKTATFMNGISATFMPMPIPSEKGSGLELEISMKNSKGNNILSGKGELSDSGNYFVGGILEHLKSILVFTNPTTNSYKRFYVDPKFMTWGNSDKSNAIFIDASGKDSVKLILTFPDSMVNPFLAYSAIMAAGFDGMKKKTAPSEMLTERPSTMGSKERKKMKIEEFPRDIMSSIESIENDIDFIKGIITPEILVDYLEQKVKEQKTGSMIPNPYEFDEYFHL